MQLQWRSAIEAGHIEAILIGKKLFTGQAAEFFEATQGRIDFPAARPDKIRIEAHAAKASFVP